MAEWLLLVMAAAPAGEQPFPWDRTLMMLMILFFAFYFIILRPQKREQQQKQQMLQTLEKGDRVVTIGGIHGTVAGVDQTKNTVHVDIGKNMKIEFSRNAISTIEKKGKKSSESEAKK